LAKNDPKLNKKNIETSSQKQTLGFEKLKFEKKILKKISHIFQDPHPTYTCPNLHHKHWTWSTSLSRMPRMFTPA